MLICHLPSVDEPCAIMLAIRSHQLVSTQRPEEERGGGAVPAALLLAANAQHGAECHVSRAHQRLHEAEDDCQPAEPS